MNICIDNSRKTLAMLQSMPQAEDITLVGSISITDVPAPRQIHSVVFESCHRFEVRNMVSLSVRRLMSTIRLPLLRTLVLQEYVTEDDLRLVPTAIPSAMASILGPCSAPTSLFVEIYPKRIIMRTEGEPAVHYVSDWRRLHSVPLGDRRILDTASAMISSLSTRSGIRPVRLWIHNGVRGPADVSVLPHGLPPGGLRAMNLTILFIRVFQSYPEVDTLELSGYIEQPLFAVRCGTLLHLSHLVIRNLAVPVTVPMYIIDRIRLSRDLELHIA
ncbi:hypothetical protein SISSUDRAFT_1056639 [Sistotremastrum suecicum HHB10207 ss-3]|uniref:F-box domain-containing protein n=1 Tax=Sistotremastrum suecicum HHB10207 ss-3 TaxID=1314776 RepID=A0A165WD36_9AGAM|nr:hypothetical protein SISSUDRAFT_1056639 [Sistotremastrum suecicum HHB10207 ss-3]